MTQRAKVLQMLQHAGSKGVSSRTFISSYMPRAAARIQELRDQGYEIESEREGKYVRYRLSGHHGASHSAAVRSGDDSPEMTVGTSAAESDVGRCPGGLESGSTGGRGQTREAMPPDRQGSASAAPGAPARAVPSMFDADDCLDWNAA